jgi:solute carrier family 35 (UDP-sugar transporter), member A1/2/3
MTDPPTTSKTTSVSSRALAYHQVPPSSERAALPSAGVVENVAATTPRITQRSMEFKRLLLLLLATVLTSLNLLLGRYTRTTMGTKTETTTEATTRVDDNEGLYNVSHLVIVGEFFKFIISCCMESHTTDGKLALSLQTYVLASPGDALKIIFPTLLYLIQNICLYVALSKLDAPVFQILYQGKLVMVAALSVVFLNRRYSVQQWACLIVVAVGVAIVVLEEEELANETNNKKHATSDDSDDSSHNLLVGLIAVAVACITSSLGGVFLEGVLKKQTASLWMRNMQLAFFSLLVGLMQQRFENTSGKAAPYFHGFTKWVWVLVLLQATAGLVAAAVMKYTDNVKKGLSTGVSVIVTSALSMLLFGSPLTAQFVVGSIMILAAVYFFINPIKWALPESEDVTEMKQLLPN